MSCSAVLRRSVLLLVGVGLQAQVAGSVPAHMQFKHGSSGVIEMKQKPELRLNVKGGKFTHGNPIVLWNEQAESHEQFTFDHDLIRLKTNPNMCLNVEGGLGVGHNVVAWHCPTSRAKGGSPHPHEEFLFAKGGRIHPKSNRKLCLNVKGSAFKPGTEVVLWHCESSEPKHELFKQDGDRITVLSHPDLHFNVAGGDTSVPGAKVVLYNDQPSAHELFEVFEGRIHLKQHTDLCLNAEGGLQAGHRVVLWPCGAVPADNELFHLDKSTGAIHASRAPELGFNAAGGGMQLGDEIVLWSLKEEL